MSAVTDPLLQFDGKHPWSAALLTRKISQRLIFSNGSEIFSILQVDLLNRTGSIFFVLCVDDAIKRCAFPEKIDATCS